MVISGALYEIIDGTDSPIKDCFTYFEKYIYDNDIPTTLTREFAVWFMWISSRVVDIEGRIRFRYVSKRRGSKWAYE